MNDTHETTKKRAETDYTKLDFSGLILGFSSAALDYLGEGQVAAESGKNPPHNSAHLELARQNIDIIELLIEKTQGNLTPDENGLARSILKDLRLKFVEKSRILL